MTYKAQSLTQSCLQIYLLLHPCFLFFNHTDFSFFYPWLGLCPLPTNTLLLDISAWLISEHPADQKEVTPQSPVYNLALPWQLCSSVLFPAARQVSLLTCHALLHAQLFIPPLACRLHWADVLSVFLTTLPQCLIWHAGHRCSSNIYWANE